MVTRIRIEHSGQSESKAIERAAAQFGLNGLERCRISTVFAFEHELSADDRRRVTEQLLADPVVDRVVDESTEPQGQTGTVVEVARRPGVTDTVARELEQGMTALGIDGGGVVRIAHYELIGSLDSAAVDRLARGVLANETIESFTHGPHQPSFDADTLATARVDIVEIRELSGTELVALSNQRLLSLDEAEMTTIAEFYRTEGRDPTDAELETLAQTWSEHCVHKTFKSDIRFVYTTAEGDTSEENIDGLMKTCLRDVTDELWPSWLRSAFVDNAGIIEFDDSTDLAIKVETHNHPSALEPFGGANTGVGGVVRDIMGVSARPIAAVDVLCFGPQDLPHDDLPEGVLHPARIAEGVIAGVGDYGNKLGLPTVAGAVLYDEGYIGNPLVFCGSVGILPTGSHPTEPGVGDLIVALGGRTGRDGIHGATFSSAELQHDTAVVTGSAVQIGDPITEKGVLELIEHARDAKLYSAITDCGAGGFSSAVGEMAEHLGAEVDLANATLKYPGLLPWEIYLSEAQERMVLAVPPANLEALTALAETWGVEVCTLGTFSGDGRLRVRHNDLEVVDLPMPFLHDGLPSRVMEAAWTDPPLPAEDQIPELSGAEMHQLLLDALADSNVASKEEIVRTYDHEVRGGSIVRPFCGPEADGPSDGAVLKPLGTWDHDRGFALGIGVNPRLGRVDPHAMALSVIDEAFRNVVAVGGDPDRIALIDNFCWGNPTIADRLGSLVRACQGCRDGALAYRAPFISGKDSLFNEFDGSPIPGTLVITALAIVADVDRTSTSNLAEPGNQLWLVGETGTHLGGSLVAELLATPLPGIPTMQSAPGGGTSKDPLDLYRAMHGAIGAGLTRSVHDLSEGGLAVTLAEMCISGRLGARVWADDDSDSSSADLVRLFSESLRRFVVEVRPDDADAFAQLFSGVTSADGSAVAVPIGVVSSEPELRIANHSWRLDDLVEAWSPGPRATDVSGASDTSGASDSRNPEQEGPR